MADPVRGGGRDAHPASGVDPLTGVITAAALLFAYGFVIWVTTGLLARWETGGVPHTAAHVTNVVRAGAWVVLGLYAWRQGWLAAHDRGGEVGSA